MVYVERPSSGSVRSPTPAHTPQYSRPFGRSLRSATPLTDTPATSASVGREGTPASDRILSGRIKKTPRKTVLRKEDVLSEKEKEEERRQLDDMNEERKLFPGSDNWADDELRLFKILFMRQYSPLLPADWQMSFRGIPIPDILFASSIAHPPIINSRSDNDYKATKALTRLIELTKDVRGLAQTGQRHRASALIGKRLQEYIRWAEQDGNYANLDYVPNIIVDVVDTSKTPQEIEEHMQQRLKIAAVAQQAHWRIDQPGNDSDGEIKNGEQSDRDPEEVEPEDNQIVLVPDKYPSPQKEDFPPSTPAHNETNGNNTQYHKSPDKKANNTNELVQHWSEKFDRQPPVVYGLFIVNTSVMVLTVDSAKEEEAYVSYQVEVGFSKRGQDVWNAITIAIVVCMARDGMIDMKDEFEDSIINYESDPDA
ncbi:hypothetical protein CkaCkLH20_01012 [Colletotrichum karsti]|uniref:Uncharacterized protein n=1 Tax=Colletotrichum karsti TaxID=1095194 RepID=A0A9P6LQM9_9PEZI|nr:uncharacterized protein CkaCkLH20_01012 [Colletotrichum karsti]KAF9881866.1 hypothetical protein CkaCkLH20_01012 [Colletotrichum karsti]